MNPSYKRKTYEFDNRPLDTSYPPKWTAGHYLPWQITEADNPVVEITAPETRFSGRFVPVVNRFAANLFCAGG